MKNSTLHYFWNSGIVLVLLLCNKPLHGISYYLSNSGSDTNSGNSSSAPWQSIDQLNSTILQPGDSILFLSGNVFSGQLVITANGTEAAFLYFGTYGGTNPAIISGATTINGWTSPGNNIYEAGLTTVPIHFFVNQQQQVISRFPNSGYYQHQQGVGSTGFIDTTLIQSDHYWDGAGIRMRTTDRLYEYNTVNSFENDSIFFQNAAAVTIENGFGYYFDNLFTELDTAGEWFYDTGEATIYYYAEPGNDPAQQITEASVFDYGILFQNGGSYCVIENLHFAMQAKAGITASGFLTNIYIRKCKFLHQGETGIYLPSGAATSLISNNSFQFINGAAIVGNEWSDASIVQNWISHIGLIAGYGINTLQQGMGISIDGGEGVVIAENNIDSTGNSAINANGVDLLIEKNSCSTNVLHFNSMGGIYSYGSNSSSVTMRNNLVLHTSGSTEASPFQDIRTGGIFLDEQAHQYQLTANTIAYSVNHGITIYRGGNGHLISGNVVYGCRVAQLGFTEGGSEGSNSNHIVTGNRFYGIHEEADIVNLSSGFGNFIPAAFDSNYYFNPYDFYAFNKILTATTGNEHQYFTLSQWKSAFGGDALSVATFFFRNRYSVTSVPGSELIGNGTFTNNTDGWVNETPENLLLLLDNSTPLDNGCMKLVTQADGPYHYGETAYNGIYADSGSFYQLGFSCFSTKEGNTAFFHKQMEAPYATLNLERYFPFTTARSDYNIVFQHLQNTDATRLIAHLPLSDSLCWFDNISLQQVETVYEDPVKKSRLFINDTSAPIVFQLLDSVFYNLDQQVVTGSITLQPYTSAILIFDSALITIVEDPAALVKEIPSLLLYPSITTVQNGINIRHNVESNHRFKLSVIDDQGRIMYQQSIEQAFTSGHIALPANLRPGIYLLVLDNMQYHLQGKFILH